MVEVDGPAIVGIDKAQVPELRTLVEVGDAGRSELEHQLRQPVDHARLRDTSGEWRKGGQEPGAARPGEDALDEPGDGGLVLVIRRQPAGVTLRFLD